MGIEIEKKFTVSRLPENLESYPRHRIEQAYLNVNPAIRVRREDDIYYMTYKGVSSVETDIRKVIAVSGEGDVPDTGEKVPDAAIAPIGKTEYNMPLDSGSYEHLAAKADGNVIRKIRYLIPLNENAFSDEYLLTDPQLRDAIENNDIKIELDVFEEPFDGRILAEVEFPNEEAARNYRPADWFDKDVTGDPKYSNSQMSIEKIFSKNY